MADTTSMRLYFLGFTEEMVARYVLQLIRDAKADKAFTTADWALVHKAPGGKVTIEGDKSVDPGAKRGALFGGGAVMLMMAITGPVGVAAVAGGAAIGAVAGALKDSGLKTKDLKEASDLMVEGRWGLVIAVPLEDTEAFEDFRRRTVEFEGAIRTYEADITPGQDFHDALAAYQAQQTS